MRAVPATECLSFEERMRTKRLIHIQIIGLMIAVLSSCKGRTFEEVFSYCELEYQSQDQCNAQIRFNTKEKIEEHIADKGRDACKGEVWEQKMCREEMLRLQESGCVSDSYIGSLLFKGPVEDYIKTYPDDRTYNYYPICTGKGIRTFCHCGNV